MDADRDATAQKPGAAELLRATLEKIVFFEWRVSELTAALSAAQTRCATAERALAEAQHDAHVASERAKAATLRCADADTERARLAALLAVPGRLGAKGLDEERRRSAGLEAELRSARAEIERAQAERERWQSEMIGQARTEGEAPAALAQFISELRAEIIALRDHQKRCEALLAGAGIAAPALQISHPPPAAPPREPEPVQEARRMMDEGRLSPEPVPTTLFALPPQPQIGAAAQALADQCLRTLASGDPRRREQAAKHLAAAPAAAAAPALASALRAETDAKCRAQLARALVACGGEGAAEIVVGLQAHGEPPLVRLAALEALCALPARLRAAVEAAILDPTPAVRRRAAAVAAAEGLADLAARFAADADASVRATAALAEREPPAQKPAPIPREPAAAAAPASAPRDPVRAALHRLVLKGGAS